MNKLTILVILSILLTISLAQNGELVKNPKSRVIFLKKDIDEKFQEVQGARFMVAPPNCSPGAALDSRGICRRVLKK